MELNDRKMGKSFLKYRIRYLKYISAVDQFSWINMAKNGWVGHLVDETNNETIRFLAVLLDNLRWRAEIRFRALSTEYRDLFGIYLRH